MIDVEYLLSQMTLEEKIGMIHGDGLFRTKGVSRLNIPPFTFSDGPMGVRQEFHNDNWIPMGMGDDYVTYLPSNTALASTWNPDLAYKTGQVLGAETRGRGKDMILAPGINIIRSPLCGRNFEYMSEDPYLISQLVVPLIEGIQESDVAACVKHFALNNQETNRIAVDTIVDQRALEEIYYPGFKAAVQQGKSRGVMGAYNKIEGDYCCQGAFLNDQLRDIWGFDGIVVSDWGGVHDSFVAAKSGLDIEMSVTNNFDDYFMAQPLLKLVSEGQIPEVQIDQKVRRILKLMNDLHMFDETRQRGAYNSQEHRGKALETARESVVLLKNQSQRLPLSKEKTTDLLIIGDNATRLHANGGGSAEIKALYEITPLLGLKGCLGGNCKVTYVPGYHVDKQVDFGQENWQERSLEAQLKEVLPEDYAKEVQAKNDSYRIEALTLAKTAGTIIYVGGLNHDFDSEGQDRESMKLPYGQDQLIDKLLTLRPDTVLVLAAGSPVDMSVWIDKAQTLLWSWYAGLEGGTALAEVIFGDINPSGKLAQSFPFRLEDSSAHQLGDFGLEDRVEYKDSIFVGYRYHEKYQIPALFPFGHGLSYSTFVYEDLIFEEQQEQALTVHLTLSNEGPRDGKEVIQVYVEAIDGSVIRPVKELKAFAKVFVPGEGSVTVTFRLEAAAFSYYNEEKQAFDLTSGKWRTHVGASSVDIRLSKEWEVSNEWF